MADGKQFPIEEKVDDDKVLVYDLGRPEDAQEVLQLYRDHFVADAPFRQIFFWEESEANWTSARHEADLVTFLGQPFSVVVRDKANGHLVAFKKQRNGGTGRKKKSADWLVVALIAQLEGCFNLFDPVHLHWRRAARLPGVRHQQTARPVDVRNCPFQHRTKSGRY